jgi:hypothetical protein
MESSALALSLAAQGFEVFPIKAGAKFPPLWADWPNKASASISADWPEHCNVGIHCADMLVVDVDPLKGGDESYDALEALFGWPATRVSRTPSGGRHVFFRSVAVPNSVGRLGAGLDVRSQGGYVVAPGSTTEVGRYEWANDLPIADAPDWLVQACGVPKTGTQIPNSGMIVPDAPETAVQRARDWLKGQAPAVQGDGGDARTYATACALRDQGVSRTQAYELLTEWNGRCEPPWEPHDLKTKVVNAYRYAENEAGSRAALPADFPLLEESGVKPVSAQNTRQAVSLSEFANGEAKGAGYVVKGLLQRSSYAEVFGAPGEGKTFIALDLAYHVAAGLPWMDRKIHPGPVLYLAYEGIGGMKKRAKALRQKYGLKDVPLYFAGASFNLREKTGRAELGGLIAGLPAKPVLIVIDTLARALMGGDENSAQDVGAFNSAVAALIESTGACVCIIHHSGKDKSKGARGSSALLGAIDTEIEVDSGQVIARKQRDVEVSAPIGFKLVPLIVGIDEDGDEDTSCVVEADTVAVNTLGRISGNARRGFDVLCQLKPDNAPITQTPWRDACSEFLGSKNVAQRFFDIKKVLLAKGYITIDEQGMITRRMV